KNTLEDSLSSFSVFTNHFFELLDLSEADIGRLRELLVVLAEVEQSLKLAEIKARETKERVMREEGITEWQIRSDNITKLISRFTIFTHKKAAGVMAGLEIEEGSQAGELTLF
ncbi:hypothetical protein LCGC14_2800480, partial [marine sediment metagenome]